MISEAAGSQEGAAVVKMWFMCFLRNYIAIQGHGYMLTCISNHVTHMAGPEGYQCVTALDI